jgi:hypothetical protein
MAMKLLPIFLILLSLQVYAEEDCTFDESVYLQFINKYTTANGNSEIAPDGKTLMVRRKDEQLVVKGGGCIHLGVAIELKAKKTYTEEQFLQKTLNLAIEFGSWLINTSALENSIEKGKYHKIDRTYFIEVDAMTVFSASYDNQGKINVDFYIN